MAPLDQELPNEKHMGFLDHLEELRSRLFKSILAIVIAGIVLFIKKDFLFDTVLFGPRHTDFVSYRMWCAISEFFGAGNAFCVTEINYKLINTSMLGNFTAHFMISMIGGLIVAFPVVLFQVWAFIKPALKKEEKKSIRGVVFYSSILFFLGIGFGYYFISPLSLQFLGNYEIGTGDLVVEPTIAVMSYVKTITSITFAAGLIFQLPIMVYFLSKVGIVTAGGLRKYRRHALVFILVLSALITPPDVTSQILVSIPVLILYEIGIIIAKRQGRKRAKRKKK